MSEAGLTGKRGLRAVPVPGSSTLPDVPIETKLHAPSLRKEWVERRVLISVLAATAAKLILIEAPAGFGKTTLAAQWRASASEDRPFAWVSLDRGDDDPGRLWWYIVLALQQACPGLGGDEVRRALRAPIPDVTGEVIPLLVNEMAALGAPVVLVLDDYHLIKERSCHEQIAFLLLNLPPSAEIVLITRTDPPLPLARERAAGEMVEIRMGELRFTSAEAAALVHNVSGVELAEPDLALLLERTEGWPAGLYLAALSLRGHPAPSAFIREFTGDNRFIVDFLAEEVLSRQPSHIRQFLARTAILDRFCAPLCAAVAGSANAAEIIDVLERENLFLVPLDDNRQWHRYHHLFAQVLRGELTRTEPDISRPCTSGRVPGIGCPDRRTRRSVTPLPLVTSPGRSTSLRAIGPAMWIQAGPRRFCAGYARSVMTRLPPSHWQRTAQRGSPPCPASGSRCGAGFPSSGPESMTVLCLMAAIAGVLRRAAQQRLRIRRHPGDARISSPGR